MKYSPTPLPAPSFGRVNWLKRELWLVPWEPCLIYLCVYDLREEKGGWMGEKDMLKEEGRGKRDPERRKQTEREGRELGKEGGINFKEWNKNQTQR